MVEHRARAGAEVASVIIEGNGPTVRAPLLASFLLMTLGASAATDVSFLR